MSDADRSLARIATGSIAVALIVLALKVIAWQFTGSVALYSDALESTINVVSASIVWQALRIGARPADEDHPFGHHKAEYMSAVVIGVLIVLAAVMILREASLSLLAARALHPDPTGLAVSALATLVNLFWARHLVRSSESHRSPALAADGRHIMSDVWTSLGALAGLGLMLVTGWYALDALIAILVGLNILREGSKVIRTSIDGLMDKALGQSDSACIRDIVQTHAAGAIEVHDIRTRSAGAVRFVEFHLVVDGRMSVAASHAICDRLELALHQAMPDVQVTIHVEPGHERRGGLRIG